MELAKLVERLDKTSTAFSMQINTEKTKLMTNTGVDNKVLYSLAQGDSAFLKLLPSPQSYWSEPEYENWWPKLARHPQNTHRASAIVDPCNNTNSISTDIRVNSEKLDCVNSFKYLGAIIADEGSKPEVLARIAQTTAALTKLKTIWNYRKIAFSSKIRLMRSLVMSIFLYACESWTLTADTEKEYRP